MKNIIIAFFLMLAPVGVTAQYQKAHKGGETMRVKVRSV